MARPMMWKPLSERVQSVLDGKAERIRQQLEYIDREVAETVAKIESNTLAACLLTEAGFDVVTREYESGSWLEVRLGDFKGRSARKHADAAILKARRALDSRRLEERNRCVDDTESENVRIAVTLWAPEFPGLRLVYSLPPSKSKQMKCRIVSRVVKTLVCEKE